MKVTSQASSTDPAIKVSYTIFGKTISLISIEQREYMFTRKRYIHR